MKRTPEVNAGFPSQSGVTDLLHKIPFLCGVALYLKAVYDREGMLT